MKLKIHLYISSKIQVKNLPSYNPNTGPLEIKPQKKPSLLKSFRKAPDCYLQSNY